MSVIVATIINAVKFLHYYRILWIHRDVAFGNAELIIKHLLFANDCTQNIIITAVIHDDDNDEKGIPTVGKLHTDHTRKPQAKTAHFVCMMPDVSSLAFIEPVQNKNVITPKSLKYVQIYCQIGRGTSNWSTVLGKSTII